MKLAIAALLVVTLTGCAGNLRLLEDGRVHHGSWNAVSKHVEVTVDGVLYAGEFIRGTSSGFGTSFGAGGTSFGTGVGVSNGGSATLISADGKVIQCIFRAEMGRGQGQCEGLDGRRFALVIGG